MAELSFEPPLSDGQLHAIGQMLAQWALLEAMIDLLVLEPKTNPNPTVDSVPLAMSFTQRLRLWGLAGMRWRPRSAILMLGVRHDRVLEGNACLETSAQADR